MTKISILVPCCNVEKYVRECLDSIRVQTYSNLEVICINDGSKDGTGAIIDEFVAADNRFKAIHKSNSGYGDSMNKGLEAATGEYIGIIESDDWIEPDMFETLLKAAEANQLDVTRCCWYEGPTGTESANLQPWVKKDCVYCPKDDPNTFYQQPAIWVSLYKRDLLYEGRQIRFLPTPGASYQDTSFAFKVYTKAKRFMMLEKCLHHYRINPNSSVSSSGKVFCLNDEWEEMARWIIADEELKGYFSKNSVFANIIYGGFDWNYHRLSPSNALRFLHRSHIFFREISSQGIFKLSQLPGEKRNTLKSAIDAPLTYHHQQMYGVLERYEKEQPDFDENNQEELISVVVTCYNTEKYVLQSLRSITSQSYRNIEIICVDDCSTDGTIKSVQHAMKRDARIRLLQTEKNSGPSVSRNLGIKSSKGKYIIFVDGDDYLLPGAIAAMHHEMDDKTDMVVGSVRVHYEEGEKKYGDLVKRDLEYYSITANDSFDASIDMEKANRLHVSPCAKMYRMDVIQDNQCLFPEGLLYEDANFYWKYLLLASRVKTLKRPVYLYQRHMAGSIMSATFAKRHGMSIQHLYIIEDLCQFFEKHQRQEMGTKIVQMILKPYFWFAWNNAPEDDYEEIIAVTLRIMKKVQIDSSESRLLQMLPHYEKSSKAKMFVENYVLGSSSITEHNDGYECSETFRITKKLNKYRKNLRRLIWLSSILLALCIALTICLVL